MEIPLLMEIHLLKLKLVFTKKKISHIKEEEKLQEQKKKLNQILSATAREIMYKALSRVI